MAIIKSIPYFGGKSYMIKDILEIMPAHKCYVEVFGGMASILINKNPSDIEVYNDINDIIVNIFKVLQNETTLDQLIEKLEYTPYSRSIFEEYSNYCFENTVQEIDVKNAWSFLIRIKQGINGVGVSSEHFTKKRWGRSVKKNNPLYFTNLNDRLKIIAKRFKNVYIENYDYKKIIDLYDSKDTLFYLDPPYYYDKKTRKTTTKYAYDFTNDDHIELADRLNKLKGKCIVSYYDCDEVRKLYNHKQWNFLVINKKQSSDNKQVKDIIPELLIYNYGDYQPFLF